MSPLSLLAMLGANGMPFAVSVGHGKRGEDTRDTDKQRATIVTNGTTREEYMRVRPCLDNPKYKLRGGGVTDKRCASSTNTRGHSSIDTVHAGHSDYN